MSNTMRAMIYTAPGNIELLELPQPRPECDEVLIRVAYVGICGSEIEAFVSNSPRRRPPLIMGHEFSGTVVAVGERVAGINVDAKVVINPLIPCGDCHLCRMGRTNVCPNRQLLSMHRPGAYAEYVSVPARAIYELPSGLDLKRAALVEPLANAVHAMRIASNPVMHNVAIIGAGTIGLLCMQVARSMGAARILVSEPSAHRREVARKLGANQTVDSSREDLFAAGATFTYGCGFDVCIDAVGRATTRKQAVQLLAPVGTAVWIGLHERDAEINAMDVVTNEFRIQGSYAYTDADFRKAIQLLADGYIVTDGWVTEVPFTDGVEAFLELASGESGRVKVVLQFDGK